MEKKKILEAYNQMLMKEQRNDKDYYYMSAILGKIRGLKVGGWELETDPMVGTWSWYNNKYPGVWLYMTPYWEGIDGIAVNVDTEDGDELYSEVIRFKPTYDSRTDAKVYVKHSQRVMKKVEGILQTRQ
jgi:hypothetical protein